MSGNTSETRCKRDEQIYPASTECISGQHEDCSGSGPLITNRKEIVDCKCKCHEPTPPEGEAVAEQKCERCDRPSKYKAAELDADKGCWIHWTHPPFLGWNVCSAKSKLIGNKWVGEPAPVVSTAAPEPTRQECQCGTCEYCKPLNPKPPFVTSDEDSPERACGTHPNFDPHCLSCIIDAAAGCNPVAPESYKPAEGPDSNLSANQMTAHSGVAYGFATPVTVEAPAPNLKAREIAIELCAELVNSDPLLYCPATVKKIENQIVELCAATPKPIGDVEAVAAEIWRFVHAHYRAEITKQEIAAILSPFFAPGQEKEKK